MDIALNNSKYESLLESVNKELSGFDVSGSFVKEVRLSEEHLITSIRVPCQPMFANDLCDYISSKFVWCNVNVGYQREFISIKITKVL